LSRKPASGGLPATSNRASPPPAPGNCTAGEAGGPRSCTRSDGATTRWCARPTRSTARARARGGSSSKTGSSPGNRGRRLAVGRPGLPRVRAAGLPAGGVFFVVHPLAGEGPLPLRASRPPGPSWGRSPGQRSATTPSAPGKGSLAQQGAFPTSGCAGGPHSDAERARKQKLHREHPQGFPKPESPAPPAARAQAYEAQVAR
jgi:hypothetical protein